jgi:hypothetical protein
MRIMSNYFPQTMALRMGNRYHVPLFPLFLFPLFPYFHMARQCFFAFH